MIRIKKGVRVIGVRPELAFILPVVDGVYGRFGVSECWVTSVTEGEHSENSRHYLGAAMDLRTRNVPICSRVDLKNALQDALGTNDWFVLMHSTHIHVELKPKKLGG